MIDLTNEELITLIRALSIYETRQYGHEVITPLTTLLSKLTNSTITNCGHDPQKTQGSIGMYHCPDCGEMQLAGLAHTKSDNTNNQT